MGPKITVGLIDKKEKRCYVNVPLFYFIFLLPIDQNNGTENYGRV